MVHPSTAGSFTPEERLRYGRHLVLPQFGEAGQQKLKAASVLLVGAGGLGSPLALYLAAAGVGRLGLVDFDVVDASNLQRQVLYGSADVGRPKLEAAADRLRDLNPHITLDLHPARLSRTNALDLIRDYDLVADGTDNFPTRYLVNDACVLTQTPNVYGSIYRFEGQVSVFAAPDGPCYRCLYEQPPPPELVPSCAEGGVLGVLPGLVGSLQATEAIKYLAGLGEPLIGRLMMVDTLSMQFREIRLRKNPDCPVCGDHPSQTELIDYEAFCGLPPRTLPEMDVETLKHRLQAEAPPFLLDVRTPAEYHTYNINGHLMPLDQFQDRLEELYPYKDRELVVHCKSGQRAARAVALLHEAGFPGAINLKGGLDAWMNGTLAENLPDRIAD